MAIKVNVGFSRKVGEPNYGSRGASVNLEVELDHNAIEDAERFRAEIEKIFEQARDAVQQELEREKSRSEEALERRDGQSEPVGGNGTHKASRTATLNQLRAIQIIARRHEIDLDRLLAAEFDGKQTEELTIVEASLMIDRLQTLSLPDDPRVT